MIVIDTYTLLGVRLVIMHKVLGNAEKVILYVIVFLIPIFGLPLFNDFYTLPKLLVLGVGATLVLVVRAIKLLTEKKIEFAASAFDVPFVLLATGYIVSTIFTNTNKMEAFFLPGATSVIIGSFILYFLINGLNFTQKNFFKIILFASALVLSLVSIVSISGVIKPSSDIAGFFVSNNLSLAGGYIPEILFLVVVLPICIEMILASKEFAQKVFIGTGAIIIVLALILSIVAILPGKPDALALPTFRDSFSVALDTIKESPILGAGPGNYISAFNRFRPISYNATPLWQVRFTTANNFYLTLITETGLIGVFGVVFLIVSIFSLAKKLKLDSKQFFKEGHLISLLLLTVLLLFLPADISIVVLLFVLVSLSANTRKNDFTIPSSLSAVPYVIALPIFALVGALYFFSYKAVQAEQIFKNSIVSLNKNDAKATYDQMRQAIGLNPYVDRYHAAYAQINMAIAQNLSQKKDISDDDKKTIATLIQQAIREGKNTVILNPTRSGNWELLAKIYQAIIPFASGSDQFALQTYSQAIALDPINPNLRITLGGVYFSLGQYDSAIDTFKLAIAAKPDFANTHYNLSAAYREKKEYDNAIAEMETVLTLVKKDSQDYKTAQKELDNLKKKKPATTTPTQTSENLTQPTKAEQAITPPIDLPQDATPPSEQ